MIHIFFIFINLVFTALKLFKMGKFTIFMSQFPFFRNYFNYFPRFYNYFPVIETRELITFRIFDVGSKTKFTNNSLKSPKIVKLNIDTLIIPQGLLIREKTHNKKSHATVPLKGQYLILLIHPTKLF